MLVSRCTIDYYVVLGIAEDADEETVRSAFRALARRYHPDVGAGSSPSEFQRARDAYETLADPERRRRYDRQLRASRAQPAVIRDVMVSGPSAEPLFASRRDFFARSRIQVTGTRSFFDEMVEEFLRIVRRWLVLATSSAVRQASPGSPRGRQRQRNIIPVITG
jgi:DnaJ-class molecular chaperone